MAQSALIDPSSGRPFELNGRNGHGDPERLKNTGLALAQVSTFSGIVGSVSKTYRWAFDEALRTSPQNALAMRRDGTIMALLRERQMPTANSKWHLEPEDPKDKHQQQITQAVTDIVKAIPRFSKFRLQLLEALWFGRYGNQLAIGKRVINGQTRFAIYNHQPIHGDKFIFRWDGTPGVLISQLYSQKYQSHGLVGVTQPYVDRLRNQGAVVLPTDRGLALFLETPQWRERFVVHMHESEDADFTEPELAGGIYGVGLRHRCYWLWWLRNEVLSSLLDYLARVGAGGLTLIGFEQGNKESQNAAESIGAQLEAGNVILVPKPLGTEKLTATVERIEPSLAGSQTLIGIVNDFFDKWLERLFVGQSMSAGADAGNGMGGTGRAQFAANTKDQLVQIDADAIDESITEQVVQNIKRWNFPMEKFKIYFKTDLANPNPKDTLEAAKTIVDMGGKVVADEILEIAGLSMPEPGDETLGGQQAGGAPGQPGDAPGESDQAPPEDDQATHGMFHDALDSGDLFDHQGLGNLKSQMAEGDMVRKYARQFSESKVHRGQPENKGQFGPGGGGKAETAKTKGGGQLNPKGAPSKPSADNFGFGEVTPENYAKYKEFYDRTQNPNLPHGGQQQPQKQKLQPPQSAQDAADNIVQMATGKAFVEPQTFGELVDFLIGLPRMVLDSIKSQVEQVKQEFGSWPGRAKSLADSMKAEEEPEANPKEAIQAAHKDGSLYTPDGLKALRAKLGQKNQAAHPGPHIGKLVSSSGGARKGGIITPAQRAAKQARWAAAMNNRNKAQEFRGEVVGEKAKNYEREQEAYKYEANFKEELHPRGRGGKFAKKGRGAAPAAAPAPKSKEKPKYEVFLIDEKGYRDGKPFIIPHAPGEMAEGLKPGYYWGIPGGKNFAGPFNSGTEATEDAEDNDGVPPSEEATLEAFNELNGGIPSQLDLIRASLEASKSASELKTGTAQPKPDWKTATRQQMDGYWAAEISISAESVANREKAEQYEGAARDILDTYTDTAMRRFTKNVNRFNFFDSLTDLSNSDPKAKEGAPSPTAILGGFYHAGHKTLNLDGGFPLDKIKDKTESNLAETSMEGVFAHEMTHAVDGPGLTELELTAEEPINRTPGLSKEWMEAGNDEIMSSGKRRPGQIRPVTLSRYAMTSPSEGFAEFGRLVYQKGRDYAEDKFPKCYAVWEKYDL